MSKRIYGGLSIQNAQEIGFFDSDSSNFVALKAPATIATNFTLNLPVADASGTQALKSDGSGNLGWISVLSTTLNDGQIYVGNGSNVATAVTPAGDVTIANDGTTAIAAGVIVDADINASAAITLSKLAAVTASKALVSDGSGFITASAVTATELGYVAGVTSAIQTQINNLSSLIQNFEWQESALDYVADNTVAPATEVSGDRYLLAADGGVPHADYDGATAGSIVEFNGSVWVETLPATGMFIAVDNETDGLYVYGGAAWSKKYFEATTASTGLVKVGFDVRLDASAAGAGLGFSAGVLSVNVDDVGIEINTDALRLKDGGVTNAKIAAAAGISLNKLAAVTANKALASDASGFVVASAVTDTELGYVAGVTSAIQTQIDAKAGRALDNLQVTSLAANSLLVGASGTAVQNLAVGTEGQVLKVVSGNVAWATSATNTFAADWVTADTATKVVTHNLGSKDVIVQIYDKTDDASIEVDSVVRTSTNAVTLISSVAPPAAGFRVLISKV